MLDPVQEVEILRAPWVGEGILVEQVGNQSVVPIGGELVGHQVGVLRDAHHIRDEQDGLARLGGRGLGDVDIEGTIVDGGVGAGWLASEKVLK